MKEIQIKNKIIDGLKYTVTSIIATFIIVIVMITCIMLITKMGLTGILLIILGVITTIAIYMELKISEVIEIEEK